MSTSDHESPARTVAFVVPSLANSSAHWEPLFGALTRLGASVLAVGTGSAPQGISARTVELPGRLITVRRRATGHNVQFYLVSPALIGLLRRSRPDVIICMEYSIASMWAIVAGRVLGRRVYIFQEHAAAAALRPGPLKNAFRRLLVRLADGVVANTPEARAEVLDVLKARPETVVDLPLLVPRDPSLSLAPPEPPPSTTEGPEFLVVGRLVAPKNIEAVLDAAAVLRAEGLQFGVTVVGDGPHAAALHDRATSAGLQDTVTFVGAVPGNRIGHYYRRADAFVLPSLGDYRSVSVLEALQFGLRSWTRCSTAMRTPPCATGTTASSSIRGWWRSWPARCARSSLTTSCVPPWRQRAPRRCSTSAPTRSQPPYLSLWSRRCRRIRPRRP